MSEELAKRVVDAIEAVAGRHDGHRRAHAKGTLCAGTFTAAPGAAEVCTAAHFAGEPVRVHARFSNGNGNPQSRDGSRDGRGLATKFYLPDGSRTDIVTLSRRQFFARTPEDFLEFTIASKPDAQTGKPDMAKLGAYFAAHPEAGPAVQEQLEARAPVSYATTAYNSLHSFRFTAPDGTQRWVRYHWEPEAGVDTLDPEAAKAADRDYLQREIAERLARGPATFILSAAVAAEGDAIEDPTVAWPDERETIELGRLDVTELATDREREGDVLVFDPTRMTEGIECSEDPILLFRPEAYAESVLRRAGVRRG